METGTIDPTARVPAAPGALSLSLVMPCYNEAAGVAQTVRRTLQAFERAGIPLQIVAVNNGSTDSTGDVLRRLAEEHSGIDVQDVEVNEGYGNGVLAGLPRCSAPWVGIIPADGQVDAEDIVRLFEDALATGEPVLAKARRRFRMDGWQRKLVSIAYNAFFRLVWPGIDSLDINGLPKIMPRELIGRMSLASRRWLLDPEIMIKAYLLGVRVLEYNVFARMRGTGLSHVGATTSWEFFRGILRFRFSSELREWRARLADTPVADPEPAAAMKGDSR